MGAMIFGYCFAAIFVAAPLLTMRVVDRRIAEADADVIVQLRRAAESTLTAYMLATWAVVCAVGSVFLLVRGRPLGWAWLGVAVVYATGTAVDRWSKRRLLDRIGDRGATERSERYQTGAARGRRFLALGVVGYLGTTITEYAYPDDPPPAADLVSGLFALTVVVGALGFVTVRGWMYYKGDELLGD